MNTLVQLFVIGPHMTYWMRVALTQVPILRGLLNIYCCCGFPSPMAFNFPSPGKRKRHGSQTSWHFIMSNELEEATTRWTWGSLHFHVDILMDGSGGLTGAIGRSEFFATLASGIGPLITGFVRWDGLWMKLGSRDSSTLSRCWCLESGGQLKDQKTSYIAGNIHQNCTYSCQVTAVKRCDMHHGLRLEGQTVVTKGTDFLGFDDERYLFRVLWKPTDDTLMLIIEEILEDI